MATISSTTVRPVRERIGVAAGVVVGLLAVACSSGDGAARGTDDPEPTTTSIFRPADAVEATSLVLDDLGCGEGEPVHTPPEREPGDCDAIGEVIAAIERTRRQSSLRVETEVSSRHIRWTDQDECSNAASILLDRDDDIEATDLGDDGRLDAYTAPGGDTWTRTDLLWSSDTTEAEWVFVDGSAEMTNTSIAIEEWWGRAGFGSSPYAPSVTFDVLLDTTVDLAYAGADVRIESDRNSFDEPVTRYWWPETRRAYLVPVIEEELGMSVAELIAETEAEDPARAAALDEADDPSHLVPYDEDWDTRWLARAALRAVEMTDAEHPDTQRVTVAVGDESRLVREVEVARQSIWPWMATGRYEGGSEPGDRRLVAWIRLGSFGEAAIDGPPEGSVVDAEELPEPYLPAPPPVCEHTLGT
jgi:hypothetical protein